MTDRNSVGAGYDTSRVHVAGIFWFIVLFCVALGLSLLAVWRFENAHVNGGTSSNFQAPVVGQPLQPSPNHPSVASQEMAALRAKQLSRLRAGDPSAHEISIDRAIDELLKSGALTQPWKNPSTQPFVRPESEPALPSVENRT